MCSLQGLFLVTPGTPPHVVVRWSAVSVPVAGGLLTLQEVTILGKFIKASGRQRTIKIQQLVVYKDYCLSSSISSLQSSY